VQVDDQVHEWRRKTDTTHVLPECVSVYGIKCRLHVHECDMQRLLEFSMDFRQQTQYQCEATTGEPGLVRSTMLLSKVCARFASGEEDMCKYFAWN